MVMVTSNNKKHVTCNVDLQTFCLVYFKNLISALIHRHRHKDTPPPHTHTHKKRHTASNIYLFIYTLVGVKIRHKKTQKRQIALR